MKKDKLEFELLPIPEIKQTHIENISHFKNNNTLRISIELTDDLVNKVKDYGYWEGLTQQEICCQALKIFFDDKKVKSRPEAVKNRAKVGRKKKNE